MFWLCVKRQWLETEHSSTKINSLNAQWSGHKHGLPSLPKLNLIWSGAGRSMGRREESWPDEKKIKLQRESTNIYAGQTRAKGCLAIPQAICALWGTRSELARRGRQGRLRQALERGKLATVSGGWKQQFTFIENESLGATGVETRPCGGGRWRLGPAGWPWWLMALFSLQRFITCVCELDSALSMFLECIWRCQHGLWLGGEFCWAPNAVVERCISKST